MTQRPASSPTLAQCLGVAALINATFFALVLLAFWLPVLLPKVLP